MRAKLFAFRLRFLWCTCVLLSNEMSSGRRDLVQNFDISNKLSDWEYSTWVPRTEESEDAQPTNPVLCPEFIAIQSIARDVWSRIPADKANSSGISLSSTGLSTLSTSFSGNSTGHSSSSGFFNNSSLSLEGYQSPPLEREIPNRGASLQLECEIPNRVASQRFESKISYRVASQQFESEISYRVASQQLESGIPNRVVSQQLESEIPYRVASQQLESEIPYRIASQQLEDEDREWEDMMKATEGFYGELYRSVNDLIQEPLFEDQAIALETNNFNDPVDWPRVPFDEEAIALQTNRLVDWSREPLEDQAIALETNVLVEQMKNLAIDKSVDYVENKLVPRANETDDDDSSDDGITLPITFPPFEVIDPVLARTSTPIDRFKRKSGCFFCIKNGELPCVFNSHLLRDRRTRKITCPILRRYVCDICGATGDYAHTRSFCPYNKDVQPKKPSFRLLANGAISRSHNHK